MKILIIGNSYPPAPHSKVIASHFLRHMALALARAGAKVRVLTPDRDAPKTPDPEVPVHWFRWTGRRQTSLITLKLSKPQGLLHALTLFAGGLRAASTEAATFKPDFILAAFALPSGLFARYAFKKHGIPYGVWCLGSDIHTYAKLPVFGWLTRLVLTDAAVIYANSYQLGEQIEALVPERKFEFLPTASPRIAPSKKIQFSPGYKHFLFVGRLEAVKGLDVLLEAWRLLISQVPTPKAMLHIIGGGHALRSHVDAAQKDRLVSNSIEVLGALPREEVQACHRATDFLVIPSRLESLPTVLTEALQEQKPVIVTDVGDMGRLVREFALGQVVPPEDSQALAQAMAQFLHAPPRLSPEKVAEALAPFDVDLAAKKLVAFVDSAGKQPL